jgi:hypothetical protein
MRPDISMCDVGRLTIGKKNNCADRRETTRVIARGSPLRPIRFLRRVRAILCRVYDRIDGRTDGRMAREATVLGDYTIARYRARTQRETVRRETVPAFSASRSDIPNSLSLSLSLCNASRRADNGANAPIRCAASSRCNCAGAAGTIVYGAAWLSRAEIYLPASFASTF